MRSKDVTNQVYTTLRTEILNLGIAPGESLREQDLCERFDASRTPVRSALERLSEENLVQFIPYKGAVTTLLHFSDIYQLILMRIVLESKVVVDFARNADPLLWNGAITSCATSRSCCKAPTSRLRIFMLWMQSCTRSGSTRPKFP